MKDRIFWKKWTDEIEEMGHRSELQLLRSAMERLENKLRNWFIPFVTNLC